MTDPFNVAHFAAAPADLELEPSHLEALLTTLLRAENPRSLRLFFWLLLRTAQSQPELRFKLEEEWLPTEGDLAQLLEDAGKDGTWIVLSLEGLQGRSERLWQLTKPMLIFLLKGAGARCIRCGGLLSISSTSLSKVTETMKAFRELRP